MKDNILIMGGGHLGLAMAAHLSYNGEKVHLWNRTPEKIAGVQRTKVLHCHGVVEADVPIEKVSSSLEGMVTKRIMVTTTAGAHRDIARILAAYVTDDTVIVLNPGRTFGAYEFTRELKEAGCTASPLVAEAQTTVYTCRREGLSDVTIYALKDDVEIATLNEDDLDAVMEAMPACLRPHFSPVPSTVATSLGNIGMIFHCAPPLMNIGWTESEYDFKYYYDGISPSVARFLEKMDTERRAVGDAMDWPLPSASEFLRLNYHVHGDNLYECIHNNKSYRDILAPPTLHHRYLEDDVPYGLVPLESAAMQFGIPTPHVSLIIDLACTVLERNFRAEGRRYRG